MAAVIDMPNGVVIALAHMIQHLRNFGLQDIFIQSRFFAKFTSRAHMLLNGNTLSNLSV